MLYVRTWINTFHLRSCYTIFVTPTGVMARLRNSSTGSSSGTDLTMNLTFTSTQFIKWLDFYFDKDLLKCIILLKGT